MTNQSISTHIATAQVAIDEHPKSRLGRPRAGSEAERLDALLEHALQIFMRDGYGLASIGKIASEAGISTRTTYGLYKNKADLMVASVTHMVERDVEQMQGIDGLDGMSVEAGLTAIGQMIIERVTSPGLVSLYRMGVAEAARFPELNCKMRSAGPERILKVIADYLSRHLRYGTLDISDINKAAGLFCHMLISEPRHQALLGVLDRDWDANAHIRYVVEIFLNGVAGKNQVRNNNE